MTKKTSSSLRKHLLFAAMAGVAVLLVAIPPAMAQDQWDKGDEWRAPYKVGDSVQFSISGRASDFQKCKVSNNEPGFPVRVECDAFKQWTAGSYVVYGKGSIRPPAQSAENAQDKAKPKDEGQNKTDEQEQPENQTGGIERPDDKGDEWRVPYKVGDSVQFSISGRASDFQKCKVSNNEPGFPMRVECDAFKQWTAGSYVVYGKSSIRPPAPSAENAQDRAKPKDEGQNKTDEQEQPENQTGGIE